MGVKIYKVKYWEKYKGSSDWGQAEMNVATNGSAEAAIKKCRANVVGTKFDGTFTTNSGQKVVKIHEITDFDPIEVEFLAEAEC